MTTIFSRTRDLLAVEVAAPLLIAEGRKSSSSFRGRGMRHFHPNYSSSLLPSSSLQLGTRLFASSDFGTEINGVYEFNYEIPWG